MKNQEKVLVVASVASMIGQFNLPNIRLLLSIGYNVDVACNFKKGSTCTDRNVQELIELLGSLQVGCYQIDFERDASDIRAIYKSCRQLDAVMKGMAVPLGRVRRRKAMGTYRFIHAHSPVGGVVGRIVARKNRVRSIYTAHGFHFYSGAPLKNWLLYYPVEKVLSSITDVIITINKEDYIRAKRHFHARRTVYVPGVGVDFTKYINALADVGEKRRQLGLSGDDIMLLSVGELIPRKGHADAIRALAGIANMHVQYFIAGKGEMEGNLKGLVQQLGLSGRVHFLGFRADIPQLCQAADLFVFPSYQEGLPLALMEAAACKTPVICSAIRGNMDLVHDARFLFRPGDSGSLERCLRNVLQDGREGMKRSMADAARRNFRALSRYSLQSVDRRMAEIFLEEKSIH